MLYEKLDYIIAIAQEQNLTRAAQKLYVSQPALTLYLNRLEEELGVKLFDRTKSPILLTEPGRYYIEEMKKIFSAQQIIKNQIRLMANPQQNLVVGIGQVRGHHWLPVILPIFCQNHPGVNIEVVQGTEQELVQDLETRKMDLIIGDFPVLSPDLQVVELLREQLFFTAHRQFGLAPQWEEDPSFSRLPSVTGERLNHLPFIIPQTGTGIHDSYERIIRESQVCPSRTICVNDLNTGFHLALKSLGVLLMSGGILQMNEHLSQAIKQMEFFVLDGMEPWHKCVAAYDENSEKVSLIQDFVRIIKTSLPPGDGAADGGIAFQSAFSPLSQNLLSPIFQL